jgi:hypothetical protein
MHGLIAAQQRPPDRGLVQLASPWVRPPEELSPARCTFRSPIPEIGRARYA